MTSGMRMFARYQPGFSAIALLSVLGPLPALAQTTTDAAFAPENAIDSTRNDTRYEARVGRTVSFGVNARF